VIPPPGLTGNSEFETERGKFSVEKEKETICRENPRIEVEEAEKKKNKDTGVVNGVMKMSNICRNKFGSCREEKLMRRNVEKQISATGISSEKNSSEGRRF
jgi:hypothetical protein